MSFGRQQATPSHVTPFAGASAPSQLPPNPNGYANSLTDREQNLEQRAEQTISDRNASIQKGKAAGRARRARLSPKKK